jgi:CheY-like chemotaxis protein
LIDEAENGREAVDMVVAAMELNNPYCMILMDYVMPVMDGPTAAKLLREANYLGSIIGVTGNVRQDEIDTFLSSGANRVMGKPLDMDLLTKLIEETSPGHVVGVPAHRVSTISCADTAAALFSSDTDDYLEVSSSTVQPSQQRDNEV